MPTLAELDVLVLDCQTTGASPAFGQVLEIGWGVVRPGERSLARAETHWIALPEGRSVPMQVRKLTGYQPSAAQEAISDSEAWRRLRDATSGAGTIPTAIHFARFELAFLREWSARFEPAATFPFDAVCLYEIANRLYPALPRLSLRALGGHLGHSLHLERRSRGHVEATAFVWQRLCEQLGARGIVNWEDLRAWLAERAPPKRRPRKPVYPIDRQRYRSLPDLPGVYRFLRSNGDVLYVGKASSLKKRTASHFVGRAGKALAPEMLTQVSDIAVTVAASALEAALLENETIKQLRPPYNVQLTSDDARVWYSARDFNEARACPTDTHAIGPVPGEYALRPLGALIALVAGASPSPAIRAHAVGVSALWPPDPAMFAAGWAVVVERYADELRPGRATRASDGGRDIALRLARKFVAAATTPLMDDALPPSEDGTTAGGTTDGNRDWDPQRVARHLERAVAQAYRAYRRARWLGFLHDCDVLYREPAAPISRLLRVRRGELVEARDAGTASIGPPPVEVPSAPVFDRARYDRLRILSTELKRVLRDGGAVTIDLARPSPRRVPAHLLRGVFAVV